MEIERYPGLIDTVLCSAVRGCHSQQNPTGLSPVGKRLHHNCPGSAAEKERKGGWIKPDLRFIFFFLS